MFVDRLATYLESLDRSTFEKQYLVNCIKEYLQFYVLEFIYNDPVYKELIFTGGTALQKCFGLDRMSEDIDLDSPHLIDHDLFANGITGYFKNRFDYNDLYVSVKGKQKKIYLKFPVLKKLELAGPDESELAYVKVEIAPLISENYSTRISVISSHNVNVLVRHYDMPDLFAGKLHAVLTRTYFKGEKNEINFKGRDFYDLFWFLNRHVMPNIARLNDLLDASGHKTCTLEELKDMLRKRVATISPNAFLFDVRHFFKDSRYIQQVADNYKDIVLPLIDNIELKSDNPNKM